MMIDFKDSTVQEICVKQWGHDGQVASADVDQVTTIGMDVGADAYHQSVMVFNENTSVDRPHITSFDELSYFTQLKRIGRYAFIGCDALKHLIFPDGLLHIDSFAFAFNGELNDLWIPDSVKTIGERAFTNCSSLEKISLPANVEIGVDAFEFCSPNLRIEFRGQPAQAATDPVLFEDYVVKKIVTDTWGHDGQFTYEDAEQVTYIGDMPHEFDWRDEKSSLVFHEAENNQRRPITKFNELEQFKNLKAIGKFTFTYAQQLKSIRIPEGVTYIGDYAFALCTSLPKITLPSTLTTIGRRAFVDCVNLRNVTLPRKTAIAADAFEHCHQDLKLTYTD